MSKEKMKIHVIETNEDGDCEENLFHLGQEYPKACLYNNCAYRNEGEEDELYCQVYVVYSGELDEKKIKKQLKEEYDLDLED